MTNIKSLRELGLGYLTYCEPNEAIQHFLDLLKSDPTNADILMLLGDWYLAAGDGDAADVFYQRANQLQPISLPSKDSTSKLKREKWLEESDLPSGGEGAKKFLNSLKESKGSDHQIQETLDLIDSILRNPNPALAAQKHIRQILDQLPILIALNAAQAGREGKIELAHQLEKLARDITR